ncbi:hypothetical protein CDAR_83181 [Caerostris darwini]|uniref:Uncharacterized protein n=1 Tax=Caerostris darwini TaxID=1538125 RepID=A0AAV4PWQ5_9ARAC|nr:hypothetical protein CDAR_83181 [Caerostris darwini]
MSYLLISEDEIMEVVFETSDPKEQSDKGEEDPVLNADLIKEVFELTILDVEFIIIGLTELLLEELYAQDTRKL